MTAHQLPRLHYAYARHALVTALRLVRVQPGARVLIPEFICRDVLASLRSVGAEPLFYEIDDALQPRLSNALQQSLNSLPQPPAAIIAVNYFGFPAALERVRQLLPGRQVPIIEDNAHGWLSADSDGTPLGSRTQVGITSVRKTIRIPDGAFVEWRDDGTLDTRALHSPLEARSESLPMSFRVRRTMARLDARSPVAIMSTARSAIRLLRRAGGKPPVSDTAAEEWELPVHRNPHRESLSIMEQVDKSDEIARRRTLFRRCEELAEKFGVQRPFPTLPKHVSPQGFPYFSSDTESLSEFTKAVRRHRIGEDIAWPALPSSTSLSEHSRLRKLHLVNFLV